MRLKSDFLDYYDAQFVGRARDGYTLHRPSINPNIPRLKMFDIFHCGGLDTPLVSYRKIDFVNNGVLRVVRYDDELAHCGDGKTLMCVEDLADDDGALKSEFIPTKKACGSASRRRLFIGEHLFTLEYESHHDWRSNAPGCGIRVVDCTPYSRHKWNISIMLKEYPIFALDYIRGRDGVSDLYLDINTSPSWRGTWLEKLLHPAVVYDFIEEYVKNEMPEMP